jgi:RNA polymerase sigma-70 factor (ECF subfamily)
LLVGDGEHPPALDGFAGRGALRGFLRISAVRECLRVMKRQKREVGAAEDDLSRFAPKIDPELDRLKRTYREEFTQCFVQSLSVLTARERTLLRMNVIEELSIDQIGAIYAVHRATAARWLERARSRLADSTSELLAAKLSLSAGEVESVIRLVHSQINVSLEHLLAPDDRDGDDDPDPS